MFEMYDVLHEKMQACRKPIFPILPSINTAGAEVAAFLAKGHVNFADEVTLGTALSGIMNASKPANNEIELFGVDVPRIRRIIDSIPENGYIDRITCRLCCILPVSCSGGVCDLQTRKRCLHLPVVPDSR